MKTISTLILVIGFSVCLKAQITLGSNVGTFGVLAATTVTNTGATVVVGNLGVSPGSAITGFPPGSVAGTIHSADGLTGTAQTELTTAYNLAAAAPSTTIAAALGGLTFSPGAYNTATSFGLTGILTLNALGNPNAQFIFQSPSTLTTASNSTVVLINGAQIQRILAGGEFGDAGNQLFLFREYTRFIFHHAYHGRCSSRKSLGAERRGYIRYQYSEHSGGSRRTTAAVGHAGSFLADSGDHGAAWHRDLPGTSTDF